jgi:acetyl esterase/lipase
MSPVIDTSIEGYGNAKIGADWKKLSPCDNVRPDLPPTLIAHGTADTTTPFLGAEKFTRNMLAAKNRCVLVAEKGAIHTYMFKDVSLYEKFLSEMTVFLASLGYIKQ